VTTAFQADAFQNDAFQVDAGAPLIPGIGPAGAATFVLDARGGDGHLRLRDRDQQDVRTAASSGSRRCRVRSGSYQATAFLARQATIATSAASSFRRPRPGSRSWSGSRYEELTIAADASGTAVNVSAAALALC
jgi:hypothetical protein